MREFIICVLIWFSMLAIVGFMSWLKDRKRRKRMTGYNELRDGQEFYGNGYKRGFEDAKKEYARPQGDCISREALKDIAYINKGNFNTIEGIREWIDNAQAVELDESVIQEVLNKRGMTAVANDYLIALHGNRPQGEWARHDEWVGGEYVGGFYHVNCPCEDGYYSKWRTNFCPNCGHPMMKGGTE